VEHYPLGKLIINRIVNKCIQWMFWCPFNDLTNAFKAYRMEVVRACGPYRASHFNITIEMSLGALIRRYQIAQIPIRWKGRGSGVSKLHVGEMGRRYASTLVKAMAEWFLTSDDVIAERLARTSSCEDQLAELEKRVRTLEMKMRQLSPQGDAQPPPAESPE
jgi:dolichol-phosphate mannosyltransferase